MPTVDSKGLQKAVDELLLREAARNEYRVSQVRLFSYGFVAVVDLLLASMGHRPFSYLAHSLPFVAISVVALWRMRRNFDRWIGFLIPVVDASFIVVLLTIRMAHRGETPGLVAAAALSCALFSATGGIRFDRAQSIWTNILAFFVYVLVLGYRGHWTTQLYPVFALLAIGLLTQWQGSLARRALAGERGRVFLKRFVHEEVVEQAFTDPGAAVMGGPREAEATVLVSDLRGFTALAEKLPPTEVLSLLNEVQGSFAESVESHGGSVDKFMGDGMLATFGAVRELEGHPDAAMQCALDLLNRLGRINASRPGRPSLHVGIGIHTGKLVVGTVGSGGRLEFTVIGDTVNVASRLEALTKELKVPVAISAKAAAEITAPLKEKGELALRGRREPMKIFVPAQEGSQRLSGIRPALTAKEREKL